MRPRLPLRLIMSPPNKPIKPTGYAGRLISALGVSNGTPTRAWEHTRRHACVPSRPNYMEAAMTDEKSVLVIGLDPRLIDFSHHDYASTGMDATKVLASLRSSEDEWMLLGY